VGREVTALKHELRDDTVEARAGVAETILARGKFTEVSRGLRHNIVVQFEDDAARGLVADADIKLDYRSAHELMIITLLPLIGRNSRRRSTL
jgi:hypothetical protein